MARGIMRRNLKLKTKLIGGQSIAEYAVIISVVTAALLAMQVYLKRGIQAAVKYSTDQFGNQEWMESDPERQPIANVMLQTKSESTFRLQQEGWGDSFSTTLTTDANTTNTGTSLYWQKEDK